MITTDEAIRQVMSERDNQRKRWTAEHDQTHEDWEWTGLIAVYAARGRFKEAAALAVAAMEARG